MPNQPRADGASLAASGGGEGFDAVFGASVLGGFAAGFTGGAAVVFTGSSGVFAVSPALSFLDAVSVELFVAAVASLAGGAEAAG